MSPSCQGFLPGTGDGLASAAEAPARLAATALKGGLDSVRLPGAVAVGGRELAATTRAGEPVATMMVSGPPAGSSFEPVADIAGLAMRRAA